MFNVSYNSLNTRNIKNLYSVKDYSTVNSPRRRGPSIYNPSSLSFDLSERKQGYGMQRRLFEFDEEYGTSLPRAPAFRTASKLEVEAMVSRLNRPSRHKHHPRECQRYIKGFPQYRYEDEPPSEEPLTSPGEVKEMVERLVQPSVCRRSHYHMYHTSNYDDEDYEEDFENTE